MKKTDNRRRNANLTSLHKLSLLVCIDIGIIVLFAKGVRRKIDTGEKSRNDGKEAMPDRFIRSVADFVSIMGSYYSVRHLAKAFRPFQPSPILLWGTIAPSSHECLSLIADLIYFSVGITVSRNLRQQSPDFNGHPKFEAHEMVQNIDIDMLKECGPDAISKAVLLMEHTIVSARHMNKKLALNHLDCERLEILLQQEYARFRWARYCLNAGNQKERPKGVTQRRRHKPVTDETLAIEKALRDGQTIANIATRFTMDPSTVRKKKERAIKAGRLQRDIP